MSIIGSNMTLNKKSQQPKPKSRGTSGLRNAGNSIIRGGNDALIARNLKSRHLKSRGKSAMRNRDNTALGLLKFNQYF